MLIFATLVLVIVSGVFTPISLGMTENSQLKVEKSSFEVIEGEVIVVQKVTEMFERIGTRLRILKKGGVVYIDVPNFGSLSSRLLSKHWSLLLPDEHKHQFTKNNLTKIFKKAGFEVLYSRSRSGLFEYNKPMLELTRSLMGLRKRFFIDLFNFPYSFFVTMFNMGDSISVVGRKK